MLERMLCSIDRERRSEVSVSAVVGAVCARVNSVHCASVVVARNCNRVGG